MKFSRLVLSLVVVFLLVLSGCNSGDYDKKEANPTMNPIALESHVPSTSVPLPTDKSGVTKMPQNKNINVFSLEHIQKPLT